MSAAQPGRHPREAELLARARGELEAGAVLAVDRHLARCARCRQLVETERRLDELVLRSAAGPLPRGATARAFEQLWSRLDAAQRGASSERDDAPVAAPPAGPVRPARPVRPLRLAPVLRAAMAAAALLVLALAWWSSPPARVPSSGVPEATTPRDGSASAAPPSPGAGGPTTSSSGAELAQHEGAPVPAAPAGALPPATATSDPDAIDPERVDAARRQVAAVLLAADEAFPTDDEAFALACEVDLAPLRAAGWAVGHLVRGHVLHGGDDLAAAGLRYAALGADASPTLALGLERRGLSAVALDLLFRHPRPLGDAPTLASGLARLADGARGQQPSDDERLALELLARDGGGEQIAALLGRAVTRALARPGEIGTDERVAMVLPHAPLEARLDALARLGGDPAWEPRAREHFVALGHADDVRAALAAAVTARVGERSEPALPWRWLVDAGLTDVAPQLAAELRRGRLDAGQLAAFVQLGGPDAAPTLFEGWRARVGRPEAGPLHAALVGLLTDGAARRALGASVAPGAVDDLVSLASALPAEVRGELLAAAFEALPADADVGGYRAYLLEALARWGDERDGRRLLAWLERGGAGAVVPLAWATAARLTADESLAVWIAAGRQPDVLAAATDDDLPWPEHSARPPSRLLRRIDRSLRLEAPSRLERLPDRDDAR